MSRPIICPLDWIFVVNCSTGSPGARSFGGRRRAMQTNRVSRADGFEEVEREVDGVEVEVDGGGEDVGGMSMAVICMFS